MKNDYINEETYEKGISILKKARIIVLLIYVIFLVVGIVVLSSGLSMEKPTMGSQGWFENSNKREMLIAIGAMLIGAPTMFTIVIELGITSTIHERSYASFKASQMMPIHKEYVEEMTPTIANMVDEIKSSNEGNSSHRDMVFCTYCGCENRRDARFCNHCGNKMD